MAAPWLLLLGVALVVATNVDNLFLLLAWFAERRQSTRDIVTGQFIAGASSSRWASSAPWRS